MNWLTSINWRIFWEPETLFLIKPPLEWSLQWWYVAFIALNLIVALASLIFKKRLRPQVYNAASTFGWSNLIIMGILYFFRVQRIPYLGMDFLRTIQEIAMLIWAVYLVRGLRTQVSTLKTQELIEARRTKYLPKPKKLG